LQNDGIIIDDVAGRFRILRPFRAILNIDAQLITTLEKIREIKGLIGGDQVQSLGPLDTSVDFRIEIRRIVYSDEMPITGYNPLSPLVRCPGDKLDLNCPMGFHRFEQC
jgi:hypothetical protein